MLSDRHMKKKSKEERSDELRPEYDLRDLLQGSVQGKYADCFRQDTKVAILEPDVAEAFPTDEAVNEALRLVIRLQKLPRSRKQVAPEGSNHGT